MAYLIAVDQELVESVKRERNPYSLARLAVLALLAIAERVNALVKEATQ